MHVIHSSMRMTASLRCHFAVSGEGRSRISEHNHGVTLRDFNVTLPTNLILFREKPFLSNYVLPNHDLPNVAAPHRDWSKLNLANTTKTGIGDLGFGKT